MSARSRVTSLILLVTVAWIVTLLLEGVPVSLSWLGSFSIVQLVVAGGLAFFDRAIWRLPPASKLLKRPVIHGTWRGEVRSSFNDEPIPSYLTIRQTYSRITIVMLTANGRSHSLSCRWKTADNGEPGVFYIYQLVPDILTRHDDPVRYGGGVLEISGNPASELCGPYWTDRQTVGKLSFNEWTKKPCSDLPTAERAEYSCRI